jgi:hypothetical protein
VVPSAALAPLPAFARQAPASTGPMKIQSIDSEFVVAPDALWRIASWLRLDAGVGYRAIGGADLLQGQPTGASGSIALRFGGH